MQTFSKAHRDTQTLSAAPVHGLRSFLGSLFQPGELIEIRAITSPAGRKAGRVIRQFWCSPKELVERHNELRHINQSANLYFGVNPRHVASGVKSSVAVTRCVWADLDHITREEAAKRWRPILPEPSIVVNSGAGIHLYWVLANDHAVDDFAARTAFEAMLKRLYRDLGADSVQDVSRVLRLPGFFNLKRGRVPCVVLSSNDELRCPLETFSCWMHDEEPEQQSSLATRVLPPYGQRRRIQGLIRYLDREVEDRSRRDFAVVARLAELGLSRDEIWHLVQGRSKFADRGEEYFQVTYQNALKNVVYNSRLTSR
jgi:hypothetical protein